MMEPTIGRIVHLHLNGCTSLSPLPITNSPDVPFQATIVYVWDAGLVNLAYHDHNGNPGRLTSVAMLHPGDTYPPCGGGDPYATWMPYQVAKAGGGDHNSESAEPRPAQGFDPSPCGEAPAETAPATEPVAPGTPPCEPVGPSID